MKLIGIVARAYYNKDMQKILQLNEAIRKVLANYEDVVPILLLPNNQSCYVDITMGEDKLSNIDKEKLDYILDKCDAFIVPGGTYWYLFDEYVIKHAIVKDKPLIAICAGFQAMCSMDSCNRDNFDMTKKLKDSSHHGKSHEYMHSINIKDNTKLKEILNNTNIKVNSVHNDYIDCSFNNLIISAVSEDNVIEAVEYPDCKFIIGIQWHPEYLMDDNSLKIFNSFIESIEK